MRTIIVAFLFSCVFSNCPGQPNEDFPFQIVIARNASVAGHPVRQNEMIGYNSTISLSAGWVLLLHYSGYFAEFYGNKEIRVSELIDTFDNRIAGERWVLRNGWMHSQKEGSITRERRPIVLERVFPVTNPVYIGSNKLHLEWVPLGPGKTSHEITIETFGEQPDRIKDYFNGNTYDWDIVTSKPFNALFLVGVKSVFSPHTLDLVCLRKLPDYVIRTGDLEVFSANQALVYGLYLTNYPELALGYFTLAATLSSEPEYQDYLTAFKRAYKF
jgi:hypothetical protein